MRRRHLIALFTVLALGVAVPSADAQVDLPERDVEVRWSGGAPELTFSAVDLADTAVRQTLDSGLRRTLLMRIYAYSSSGQPLAVEVRACHVTFDIWQERYRVQYRSSTEDRDESFGELSDVLERCLAVHGARVGEARHYASVHGQNVYFGMILEVNPIDPATVQRLRRWLSQPAGGGRVGGQAFFGSMVSLFVNRRIGSADRTLRFRSQSVRAP